MSDYGKGIPMASGFDLGAEMPLDSRITVNTIEERDAHVTGHRAYVGMKVYVISEGKEYKYNGLDWELLPDKDYVDKKVSDLVNSAPETLDTLNKLSQALGDDPNFATTVLKKIGDKADKSEVPTKTSELINDSGFITSEEVPTNMSQLVNDSGFITSSEVPTNMSQLVNDVGYATSGEIPVNISQLINDSGFITNEEVTVPIATSESLGIVKIGEGIDITNDGSISVNIPTKTSELINDSSFSTESYVNTKIAGLVNSAPETLDTLNELSQALGNDPNFASTISKKIGMLDNNVNKILQATDKPPTFTNPKLSLSVNKGVIEHKVETSIIINPTFNQNDAGAIISYSLKKGSDILLTSTNTQSYMDTVILTHGSSVTYSATVEYSEGPSKLSTFEVEYPGISAGSLSSSAVSRCYAKSYYGVIDSLSLSESDISSLSSVLGTSKGRTLTYSMINQRSVYMYPQSFGALTSIKDANNFEYINSYTRSVMNYNDVDYYVYILTDPVTITGFKQVFN